MASVGDITELRRMINEPTEATYSDSQLSTIIDASANTSAAAASIWQEKAAKFAQLVDVKEGSSSRNLGDLYEQALSMSKHYSEQSFVIAGARKPARTRGIDRP